MFWKIIFIIWAIFFIGCLILFACVMFDGVRFVKRNELKVKKGVAGLFPVLLRVVIFCAIPVLNIFWFFTVVFTYEDFVKSVVENAIDKGENENER